MKMMMMMMFVNRTSFMYQFIFFSLIFSSLLLHVHFCSALIHVSHLQQIGTEIGHIRVIEASHISEASHIRVSKAHTMSTEQRSQGRVHKIWIGKSWRAGTMQLGLHCAHSAG
jgi:hypothetical protein